MPQHDYNLENAVGANFRADTNNALIAIVTQNSGSIAPSTNFKYQFFANETTGKMQFRDATDGATWYDLWNLNESLGVGAGGNITVQEEGTDLTSVATTLNFVGDGVTATGNSGTKEINIPGFTPTKENLYDAVRDILFEGTRVTFNEDDDSSTITINASGEGGGGGSFIPQGDVEEIDVLTVDQYNAITIKDDETLYLVEGDTSGGSFTPTQANLYDAVKDIFVPGTNTTLTETDGTMTIAVNATADIPQGDVTLLDVLTATQYEAATKNATTLYLVEGEGSGGSFTPTQANLYDAVKDIFIPGTNTTLTETDGDMTIAVNATGGGSFTPTQANLYDAVKDIFVAGANTTLTETDGAMTIAVNATADIPQGDVDEVDVLTPTEYNAITTKDDETLYLVEGQGEEYIPKGDVTAMDSVTQDEYDAITTKSATTLYIIAE